MEKEQTVVTNYDITPDSLTPISSGELDLCRQWVEKKKLEEEIRTGVKLRHAKPKLPYTKELRVVDVKSKKRPPPSPKEVKNRLRNVKTLPGTKKLPSRSKTSSSCNTKCKTNNCQTRKYNDCPTRIIELAAPSKRHCLETWRNRAGTLPPLMLERLMKYVHDEAPVIPIGDAITCFQLKKNKSKKKPKPKSAFISERDKLEYRNISSIFGSKIVRKLMTPMKIQLKDNWQRVADNVQYDTAKLMGKCCRQTEFGAKMNEEVANKVTVWIATILDESEIKLLDDELEDINEVEGPVIEFIEELIDQAIVIVNEKIKVKYSDTSLYESDDETSSYADTDKISEDSNMEDATEIKDVIKLGKSSKSSNQYNNDFNKIPVEDIDENMALIIKEVITEIIDSVENNFVDAIDIPEPLPGSISTNTDINAVDKVIEEPELQEAGIEISKENKETEDIIAKDDGQEIADVNVVNDVSRSGSQTFQLAEDLQINNFDENENVEVKIPDTTIEIETGSPPINLQDIEKDMNQLETEQFNINVDISTEYNIIDNPNMQSASKAEAAFSDEINKSPSKEKNILYEDIEPKELQQDVKLSCKSSETNLLDESIIQTKHNNLGINSTTKLDKIHASDKQENVDDLTTSSIIKLLTNSDKQNEVSATNSVRQLLMNNTETPVEKVDISTTDSATQLLMNNTETPVEKVDISTTDSATQLLMNNTETPVEKVDISTTDSATQLLMNNTETPVEKVDISTTDSATQLLMNNTETPVKKVDISTTDSATQLLMDNTETPVEKVDILTTDSATQLLMDNTETPVEKVDILISDSATQLFMDNTGKPADKADKSTTDSATQLLMDNTETPVEKVDILITDSATQLFMDNTGQPADKADKSTTDSATQLLMDSTEQLIEKDNKSTTDSLTQLLMDNTGQAADKADKSTIDYATQLLMDSTEQLIEKDNKSTTDSLTQLLMDNTGQAADKADKSTIDYATELVNESGEKRVSSSDAEIMSSDSEMKLLVKNLSRAHQSIGSSFTSVSDFLGKHIHFSTPKPELLTKVDESWPAEISRTKITANVSKSITSLGNIREYFLDEDEIKPGLDTVKTVDLDITEKDVEPIEEVKKLSVDQKIDVKDDVSAKGDSNIQLVPKKQVKFEYKVNPETAPVWLRNYINEPNAIGLQISKSSPTKEHCMNLYEAYSVMENWSQWLQKTCEDIERLKNNEVSFEENRIKNWAQLKNHIDFDIAKWKIFCAKTKTATRRIQSKPSCKCNAK